MGSIDLRFRSPTLVPNRLHFYSLRPSILWEGQINHLWVFFSTNAHADRSIIYIPTDLLKEKPLASDKLEQYEYTTRNEFPRLVIVDDYKWVILSAKFSDNSYSDGHI